VARRKISNGMVVWARVPDRHGIVKDAARPLLVTSVHPVDKKGPFVAHCISTRAEVDPQDPYIEMPWDAQTGAGTGLYKWCAVVLKWSVIVEPIDVEEISGKVSPAFLAKVKQTIADVI